MTESPVAAPPEPALLTDFYQLTMAQAYFELGMGGTAVFELFVRRLPRSRRFLIAAGLERAIGYLETLRFEPQELEFLAGLGSFPAPFLDHLGGLRFSGSVHALAEGTPFFADEPILRVTAPLIEAQLVESRLINILHFDSLIASKAARCVLAADGRRLIDFGLRRAHGADAGLHAARAAYLAGFDATATVEAGRRFRIPLAGTMAHSFVQAHASEAQALRNFLAARRGGTTLLIDTYDTECAAHEVVAIARELERAGQPGRIQGVRIDSGDLAAQARAVRAILDAGGCREVKIVLSGSLDEHGIRDILASGAPADAFGVGTRLDVSADAPALDIAYKLQEYAGAARRKRSLGKATWPGRKQVWRARAADGRFSGDVVALEGESHGGEPLIREVMRDGRRCIDLPQLGQMRAYCREQIASLPEELRALDGEPRYPVEVSPGVRSLAARVDAAMR